MCSKISDYFNLTYDEIIDKLKEKYGEVNGNYFSTKECKSTNKKRTRTNEGLHTHHVYEKHYPNLSSKKIAKKYPWEFQEAKNLVYCNLFEHTLLHTKIYEEYGLIRFGILSTLKQLNYYLTNSNPKQRIEKYFLNMKNNHINKMEEYFDLIEYMINILFNVCKDKVISTKIVSWWRNNTKIICDYKFLQNIIGDIQEPLFIERLVKIYFDRICNEYNDGPFKNYLVRNSIRKSPITSFHKLKETTLHIKNFYEKYKNCYEVYKNKEKDCRWVYESLYKELCLLEDKFLNEKIERKFLIELKQHMYLMLYMYSRDYHWMYMFKYKHDVYYPHDLYFDIIILEEYLFKKACNY